MNTYPTTLSPMAPRRAVAYVRVSTEKIEQKDSLRHQREFFEEFVERCGDTLVNIYCDEGKSATKMKNRTDLNNMIKAAKKREFDVLYVKDISRLFRNMRDFVNVTSDLKQYGVAVHYVDLGRDVDDMVLSILALTAQMESEKMSSRVKFTKNMSKEKGIVPNFVFGYDRIDKWTLVPNPEESATVRLIFDKYTEERWGQARIAKYLHENGYKTKKMKEDAWSNNTVGCILTNQLYIGKVVNGRETTMGVTTNKRQKHSEDEWIVVERPEFRIISDEQWQKAQRIRKENAAKFPYNSRRSEKHIFSNLIRCGHCGFAYRRYQRRNVENGPLYVWWTCSKRSAYGSDRCTAQHIRIDEDWLITAIRKLLGSMVEDKHQFYMMVERKCNEAIRAYLRDTMQVSVAELKSEIEELEKERTRVKEMARRGIIDFDEAEKDMAPLNQRMNKLRFQLKEADKTEEITKLVKERIKKFLANFSALDLTQDLKNGDLRRIIDKIVVNSKEEIYVYFKCGDDDDGISIPFRLSDTITIDTDTEHGTQRSCGKTAHVQPESVSAGESGFGGE